MTIYGYFVTYTDYNDSSSHKDYGLIAAENRANAIANIEDEYENAYSTITEIGVTSIHDDDEKTEMLDRYRIGFFLDAMKQNGYDEEGN